MSEGFRVKFAPKTQLVHQIFQIVSGDLFDLPARCRSNPPKQNFESSLSTAQTEVAPSPARPDSGSAKANRKIKKFLDLPHITSCGFSGMFLTFGSDQSLLPKKSQKLPLTRQVANGLL